MFTSTGATSPIGLLQYHSPRVVHCSRAVTHLACGTVRVNPTARHSADIDSTRRNAGQQCQTLEKNWKVNHNLKNTEIVTNTSRQINHIHTQLIHIHTLTNRQAHTPNRIPEVEISAVAESGKKDSPLVQFHQYVQMTSSSPQDH